MALRFNVPPNWPEPPEGWVPQPGWQPDPAWGPAPEGWVFWVEDEQQEDPTPTIPLSDHSADPAQSTQPAQGEPQQVQGNYAGTPSSSPHQAAPQGNYRGSYPGQPSYHQPHAQGSPYAQPAQKSFFKSTAGILTIIGIVFLVLIVAAVFIVGALFRSLSNEISSGSSDSYTSDTYDPDTSDPYSSDAPNLEDADSGSASGDVIEYSGSGQGLLNVSERSDSGKPAWVEYEYTPDQSGIDYSSFRAEGNGSSGSRSDVFVLSGKEGKETRKGSFWMDASDSSYYEKTETLTIDAQGEWTVKVHPASDAPQYGKGDTIKGDASTAFRYKGDAKKVRVKFSSPSDDPDNFTLEARDPDLDIFTAIDNGSGNGYESTNSIDFPEGTQMVMDNSFSGSWEISFE